MYSENQSSAMTIEEKMQWKWNDIMYDSDPLCPIDGQYRLCAEKKFSMTRLCSEIFIIQTLSIEKWLVISVCQWSKWEIPTSMSLSDICGSNGIHIMPSVIYLFPNDQ